MLCSTALHPQAATGGAALAAGGAAHHVQTGCADFQDWTHINASNSSPDLIMTFSNFCDDTTQVAKFLSRR